MLDFRNTNSLWASVLVETLARLGLTVAITSPGSRSTPLTVAFATHPRIKTIPILDERSASFFALGHAKASGQAVVLVCTSGTAGANYYAAMIEAYESQIPLLVLTADRPPELRDCGSGQTIDQHKLFGRYVRAFAELSLPQTDRQQLSYLRQVIVHYWQQCHFPVLGPVHLNCPFRDPLAPVSDPAARQATPDLGEAFFAHVSPAYQPALVTAPVALLPANFGQSDRGLIIAGPAQPQDPKRYCEAIAALSQQLNWPVLADGLSPVRNYAQLNPHLIPTYEMLLRHPHHAADLVPEQVIQLGDLPTSKVLREWLAQIDPWRWIVTASERNLDPLHGRAVRLSVPLETLAISVNGAARAVSHYSQNWHWRNAIALQKLNKQMQQIAEMFEGKLSWLLPAMLPPETPLMIANSMPVRDVEWFWPLNDKGIRTYFSRGANGIDGTLSTAAGIAYYHQQAVLLTGDLALLHDSNGLLNIISREFSLTILLINNEGGGIFEMLPISQFDPPFETYFATPQKVDFRALAQAHGVTHYSVRDWSTLKELLADAPFAGVRLLELTCDRKRDREHRQNLLQNCGRFEQQT